MLFRSGFDEPLPRVRRSGAAFPHSPAEHYDYTDLIMHARDMVDALDDGDAGTALEAHSKFVVGGARALRQVGSKPSRPERFEDFGDVLEPDDA